MLYGFSLRAHALDGAAVGAGGGGLGLKRWTLAARTSASTMPQMPMAKSRPAIKPSHCVKLPTARM